MTIFRTVFLSILFAFHGCTVNAPSSKGAGTAEVVLFLPGYKGSTLVTDEGQTRWLTLREALVGETSLSLEAGEKLHAGEVFKNLAVLPFVYDLDIYQGVLSKLKRVLRDTAVLLEFPYDWRADNYLAVQKLDTEIRRLRASGTQRVNVVAHSMGGLVLAYYLRYGITPPEAPVENWAGAQLIDAAAIIATPFRGTLKVLRDFQRDTEVGWNNQLLSARAVRTFPSLYQMLPPKSDPLLIDACGCPLTIDLFDPTAWVTHGFSPADKILGEQKREALIRTGMQFTSALQAPGKSPAPPGAGSLLVVRGRGLLTEERCVLVSEPRGFIACNAEDANALGSPLPDSCLLRDGDGVVTARSSTLPDAYRSALNLREVDLHGEHIEMLLQDELHTLLRAFFKERTIQ